MQLHLETHFYGEAAVVDCSGRLVFKAEAQALCDRVTELLRNYRAVVINLNGVNATDGAGLGSIAACVEKAQEAGRILMWCELQREVRRLLELTGMARVLEIYNSEAEALEACRVAA